MKQSVNKNLFYPLDILISIVFWIFCIFLYIVYVCKFLRSWISYQCVNITVEELWHTIGDIGWSFSFYAKSLNILLSRISLNAHNDLLKCFQKVIRMINGLSDIDKSRYHDQGNRYTKKGCTRGARFVSTKSLLCQQEGSITDWFLFLWPLKPATYSCSMPIYTVFLAKRLFLCLDIFENCRQSTCRLTTQERGINVEWKEIAELWNFGKLHAEVSSKLRKKQRKQIEQERRTASDEYGQ